MFIRTVRRQQIRQPNGFAIKELLIVSAMVAAFVILPIMFVELAVVKPQQSLNASTGFVDRVEVFPAIDISLGDDFVAVVRLETFSRHDSAGPTFLLSRLRIARKYADAPYPFLFSIDAGENHSWDVAPCRFWMLASTNDEYEHEYEYEYEQEQEWMSSGTASPSAHLPNSERSSVDRNHQRRDIQYVMDLEPALRAFLPADLQQSHGILRICRNFNFFQLRDMHDFPFPDLAAAIRTASTDNDWTTTDPQVLLQQYCDKERNFDDEERTALAQSLLWRLYTMLPPEDQKAR